MRYSPERKEAVLWKMRPPHDRLIKKLSREDGLSEATLFGLHKEALEKDPLLPLGDRSPEDWSAIKKITL